MALPNRKPAHQPESYDPKVPEIVGMVEQVQGNVEPRKPYVVKTANGGSYIDDAPMLGWGKWQDNTYCGCIAAVTEVLGAPVSYETLMGVSGLCYRIGIKVNLDPSSEIPQNGDVWDDQISAAIGYEMYAIEGERKRGKRARGNLDTGRPVLGMGLFADPEWEILTGYDKTAFFGRSYFHTQTPLSRQPLPDMPGEYLRAVNYPGVYPEGFMRFFDKPCEKGDPLALLKKSLEICIAYWNHTPRADNRFGEAAYRLLIEKLQNSDEAWKADCGCMHYHIGCLADARRSAYVYLRDASALLGGMKQQKLMEIAGAYQSIADDILAVTPYEMLNVAWAAGENGAVAWSGEVRHNLVAMLEKAIETEKQIQVIVKDLLERWEEPESYDPKAPEIVGMVEQAQEQQEKIIKTFDYNGIAVDLVEWPSTTWCGKIGYADSNGDEPNVDKIMGDFMVLDTKIAIDRYAKDWDACVSVNYLSPQNPNGVMIGFVVGSEQQPDGFDIYKVPAAQYMRIRMCKETAKALGRKTFEGGIPPYEWIGEQIAPKFGYTYGDPSIPIFEYYGHYNPKKNGHEFTYLYVPVQPKSYDPKAPEIVGMVEQAQEQPVALPSDTVADPFAGGEPPRTSNRITEYRRIQNWENYFLASAICSVAKLVGFDEEALTMFAENNGNKGMHFFSAITGDMFTPMYDTLDEKPADSGFTACFFAPQVIKRAFAAFGRDCTYLSAAYIKENLRTVTNAIKASIDKGIPVLAWGMGNVTLLNGNCCDLMPEGCLIGGYDGDTLHVNLYCGPERVETDDDGYTTSADGLLGSKGLFFVGEPIEKTPLPQIYREAIAAIPSLLTQPPAEGILFGRAAFDLWADNLLDETNFTGKTEEELGGLIWSLHCKPYCNVCTSNADHFIRAAAPEVEIAAKLLPLYERFFKCKDKIWKLSGGFYPPAKKFRQRKFRAKIAALLREMGAICGEILKVFEEGEAK
ncbi:MAG: GyrI-like domain-containing protein [Oscillospiraceae bacterium]|nr:GyrI-like domain-containing protein [Oscillospiraceae bacterium]